MTTVSAVRGFRRFLLRGNVVELGLAVVIGVAFNALVQSLIRDLVTPLIAAAGGQHDFSMLVFKFNHSTFRYGSFINTVISFIVITATVYYLLIAPTSRLAQRAENRIETSERPCPECLSDIPLAAKRCRYCTAEVIPATVPEPAADPGTPRLRERLTSRLRNS
jgi:large conductance mechanosensitive channel